MEGGNVFGGDGVFKVARGMKGSVRAKVEYDACVWKRKRYIMKRRNRGRNMVGGECPRSNECMREGAVHSPSMGTVLTRR